MTDTLLTTAIAVSALLALVLLTRRAVARQFGARAAYALWLLPPLRLVMPSIQLPTSWFPALSTPAPVQPPSTSSWTILSTPPNTSPVLIVTDQPDIVVPLLISIWVTGIVAGVIWALRSQYMQARHLRRTTLAVPDSYVDDIRRAARLAGLSKTPLVKLSTLEDGPLICGLIRPVIVLPKDFTTRFTPTQRRLALLHEMTHIRRSDLWTASAMLVFRLAIWPNPLVHWAWPRFRADQEAACDATVLRRAGETARADYAETLLTAARTAGRATPAAGTGLTLYLHHPIKERLMNLGTNTKKKHDVTRWALAAMLLAGTTLSAPLSIADDQVPTPPSPETAPTAPKVVTNKTMRIVVSNDGNGKSFEVREENGVKTYLRVSRDGTTEKLTREELEAEYGVDLSALSGPRAPDVMQKIIVLRKSDDAEDSSYEIKIENDVKRAFRIAPDGTRTEVNIDEIGEIAEIDVEVLGGTHAFAFPDLPDGQKRRFIHSEDEISVWVDGGEEEFPFAFGLRLPGAEGTATTEARMRTAQSIIDATDRMIEGMRKDAYGAADKDLRNAERELRKAHKALDKAMEAVRKSEER